MELTIAIKEEEEVVVAYNKNSSGSKTGGYGGKRRADANIA